jgi:hypothetical protein
MEVEIPDNILVRVGSVITNQTQVANLPSTIGNPSKNLTKEIFRIVRPWLRHIIMPE